MASIFSLLPPLPPCSCPSLSLRPHSSWLAFALCILSLGGSAVLFFCRSSGHKAKESPRQPSVYKAFCHVDKDEPFLSLTSQISNSNIAVHLFHLKASLHLHNQCPLLPHLCEHVCVCERVYVCLCGRARRKPCFFPGIIDLTNCRPCFILRK